MGDGLYEREYLNGTPGTITKRYLFGGQAIGQKQGSQTTFFLNDHLGGLLATMSGAAGGAVHTILLRDAWGKQMHKTGTAPIGTAYLYTGQRWDELLGLYDYNARWYDPGTGRFVSADTVVPDEADPQAWNRLAYVLNSPIVYNDPDGHVPNWFSRASDFVADHRTEIIAAAAVVSIVAIGVATGGLGLAMAGAVIGGGLDVAAQAASNGGLDNLNVTSVAISAVSGALGAGVGVAIGRSVASAAGRIGANTFASAIIGGGTQATREYLSGESPNTQSILVAAGVAGVTGGLGAVAAEGMTEIARAGDAIRNTYNNEAFWKLTLWERLNYSRPNPAAFEDFVTPIANAVGISISNAPNYWQPDEESTSADSTTSTPTILSGTTSQSDNDLPIPI